MARRHIVMGTPRYAAPEQALGDPRAISAAADVYSLGAILYELTTGASVFRVADMLQLLEAIRHREPVAPRILNPSLDRDLETICLKCLQKSPRDRYANAGELADELQLWLRGEPIQARPVSAIERSAKWVKRHPGVAAFAGVSLVAMLALAAFVVSLLFQSRLARTNNELATARNDLTRQNDSLESQNTALDLARADAVTAKESSVVAQQAAVLAQAEAARQRDLVARHRYASDTLAASRAWHEGDIARLESLLKRNVPAALHPSEQVEELPPAVDVTSNVAATPDLRGFERYYLHSLTHSDLGQIPVETARHSPDGTLLALVRADEVLLLDPDTLQVIRRMEGAGKYSRFLAFSRDGKRLIGGGHDPGFRVWNVEDGRLLQTFNKHSHIGRTALSPDGTLALTTGAFQDRTVKLWRVNDGEVMIDWFADHDYAGDIEFSHDGKWFAVGWPKTNSVRIGPTDSPENFVDVSVKNPGVSRNSLTDSTHRFDPESQNLYISRGIQVGRIAINGLSPDSIAEPTAMTGMILDLRSDGNLLATSNEADHSLAIWQLATSQLLNQRKGHVGGFSSFSFRGTSINDVSAGPDQTVRFCDALARQDFTLLWKYSSSPTSLVYSPDNRTLLVADFNHVHLVEGNGGRTLEPALQAIWKMALSPDGSLVAATSSYERKCLVWRVADGDLVHQITDPQGQRLYGIDFDPKGERLAIGNEDGTITQWDVGSGMEVSRQGPGDGTAFSVRFRPGTDELVSSHSMLQILFSGSRSVRAWNSANGDGLAFTHDGNALFAITTLNQAEMVLLDAENREQLQAFSGHQVCISCHALSPDGTRLATGSPDGTVKLWDVTTGQETMSLPVIDPAAITFSQDGSRLLVGLHNGEVRAHDALPDGHGQNRL